MFRSKNDEKNNKQTTMQPSQRIITRALKKTQTDEQIIRQLTQYDLEKKEEVKKAKQAHIHRLEDKENHFKCILNADFFENPMLTSCGHYFEKADILHFFDKGYKECPCCRTGALTKEQLMLDSVMQNTVRELKTERQTFLNKLDQVIYIHDLKQPLDAYETFLDKKIQFFLEDGVRKKRYHQLYINDRIDALKLNKNNVEHLKYWQDQTARYWQSYGTTKVNEYCIPSRIAAMMEAAQKPYRNKDEFLLALDAKRKNDTNFLFSMALYFEHSANTARVYDAKDIGTVDLRI